MISVEVVFFSSSSSFVLKMNVHRIEIISKTKNETRERERGGGRVVKKHKFCDLYADVLRSIRRHYKRLILNWIECVYFCNALVFTAHLYSSNGQFNQDKRERERNVEYKSRNNNQNENRIHTHTRIHENITAIWCRHLWLTSMSFPIILFIHWCFFLLL